MLVGRLTDRIGLGVLTRVVSRDLVDEVVAQTGRREKRQRLLPAWVVVYSVLAMTLFFDDAYEEVMRKLVDGLRFLRSWDGLWQVPSSAALGKARARLGEDPVRKLFRRVAVPLAGAGTPGAWLAGRRVMAIDGVRMDVRDTPYNEAEFGRGRTYQALDSRYPKVKVVRLAEFGMPAIVDAEIGAVETDERELARVLLGRFEPGMLVLADRGFFSHEFWREAIATGADLLWWVQSGLKFLSCRDSRMARISPGCRIRPNVSATAVVWPRAWTPKPKACWCGWWSTRSSIVTVIRPGRSAGSPRCWIRSTSARASWPRPATAAGNSKPVWPSSRPASVAATGCCARTVPPWCARRSRAC